MNEQIINTEQNKLFNKFTTLPYIPYNIILELTKNDNIFKILKYSDYDCLSKPNLSLNDKIKMIWKNQDNQEDYNIFLSRTMENMILEAKTILRIYKYDDIPVDCVKGLVTYEIDILYGDKIAMIDYNGVPCNRGDVLQTEILQTLNGCYVNGLISELQYNRQMSRTSKGMTGLNMQNKYLGQSMILVGQISNL